MQHIRAASEKFRRVLTRSRNVHNDHEMHAYASGVMHALRNAPMKGSAKLRDAHVQIALNIADLLEAHVAGLDDKRADVQKTYDLVLDAIVSLEIWEESRS